MFKPIFLLYALLICISITSAKKNRKLLISVVASFIVLNLMNMDFIAANYATKFISIFIYEIVNVFISYVLLLITYNLSKLEKDALSFIVEVLVSIGLVLIYAYFAALILNNI